jgi:hypothetical protein
VLLRMCDRALQRKSYLGYQKKELRGLSPSFHIHASVSDLYVPRIDPHIFLQQNRQADLGNMYINRSQTHECGNWDQGRAIPFLSIFVSNFQNRLCSVCTTVSSKSIHEPATPSIMKYKDDVVSYIPLGYSMVCLMQGRDGSREKVPGPSGLVKLISAGERR